MKAVAIIVAAGKGVRMKSDRPKQYLSLKKEPVLRHTLKIFNACDDIEQMILVVPQSDISYCRQTILSGIVIKKKLQIVAGGRRRQDSVEKGLLAVEDRESVIVIHDGVRPFVDPGLIARCIEGAIASGACIAAVPLQDTLKSVGDDHIISTTVDRSGLWIAQTPQAFRYDIIARAHQAAKKEKIAGTDDAVLVERMGLPVKITHGSRRNIKLTDPEDLKLAEAILCKQPDGDKAGVLD